MAQTTRRQMRIAQVNIEFVKLLLTQSRLTWSRRIFHPLKKWVILRSRPSAAFDIFHELVLLRFAVGSDHTHDYHGWCLPQEAPTLSALNLLSRPQVCGSNKRTFFPSSVGTKAKCSSFPTKTLNTQLNRSSWCPFYKWIDLKIYGFFTSRRPYVLFLSKVA